VKFHPTPLHGAYTIELEKRGDDRGFFARFFCQKEFEAAGVPMPIVQINNSLSAKAGTLRGMHYQLAPAAEIKVVRCIRGALYDAIVDLRPDSPTFGKWYGVELTAENRRMIFVPQGFAHGIMTLTDDTEAFYLVNAFYAPEQERGYEREYLLSEICMSTYCTEVLGFSHEVWERPPALGAPDPLKTLYENRPELVEQAIGRPVARTLSFLFPDAVKPLYYGSEELLSAT